MRGRRTHLPGREGIKDEDLARRVDLLPRLHGGNDDIPSRQPRLGGVIHALQELLASKLARLLEPLIKELIRALLVPAGVEVSYAG